MDKQLEKEKQAISTHYDLPPEFFKAFLGPKMAYSCAYFSNEDDSLEVAEENKLKLTCEKLELKESEKLLDIGCGWGSMLFYAAENYGCKTIGITLAQEQVEYVNEMAKEKSLEDKVEAKLMHASDMRFKEQHFEKIVTIGAIEHMQDLFRVFRAARRILKEDGLMLVHGMTQPWERRYKILNNEYPEHRELIEMHWGIGCLQSISEVIGAMDSERFEVLDLENITHHYQLTVERWLENLEAKEDEVSSKITSEEKYREFVAAMASHIVGFEFSSSICQQILCQKLNAGDIRPTRPLQRTVWEEEWTRD